eukprot:CAMPEP_0205927854 /NCGR_PEP_ID=MMETSP1325-20131115/23498_1 /ASSEMBLY_ACC=CAM_ASM_000708 /TAXON_ID=236786 /ORGANISM="Florenciella sp., Strain RCC1007" /LENGTH=31 /DNA_ID= /DNA_START= /DNA_END= /DNA_ORIENTATION=
MPIESPAWPMTPITSTCARSATLTSSHCTRV